MKIKSSRYQINLSPIAGGLSISSKLGFNLEDTHVIQLEQLAKIPMLVMVTFVWCYKIGDYINQMIKPNKIRTHDKRQVSIFKCGLVYLSECLLS